MLFRDFFYKVRIRAGLSRHAVSKLAKASYSSVRLWEAGDQTPNAVSAYSLDKTFGLPDGTIQNRIVNSKEFVSVYLIHPLRFGDEQKNRAEVSTLCRMIAERFPNILIFSPIHNFSYVSTVEDQTWVMEQCTEFMAFFDEAWAVGNSMGLSHSEGASKEMHVARELKMPLRICERGDDFEAFLDNVALDIQTTKTQ